MTPFQAMRLRAEVVANSDVIVSTQAFPASNFTYSGGSATDLLNGAGGTTVSISFTKLSAGTALLVSAGLTVRSSTPILGQMWVNDGTTDNFIARTRADTVDQMLSGDKRITGLAAGTYTLKIRVAASAGATFTFGTQNSAYLTAMEIP